MKCVNKRCLLNGSLNKHINLGLDFPEPESGCRKYNECELEKCLCFLNKPKRPLQWFAGNGWESKKEADILKTELDEALSIISGLQQPIRADSKEAYSKQKKQNQEDQEKLHKIANHLYESLTGEKI